MLKKQNFDKFKYFKIEVDFLQKTNYINMYIEKIHLICFHHKILVMYISKITFERVYSLMDVILKGVTFHIHLINLNRYIINFI